MSIKNVVIDANIIIRSILGTKVSSFMETVASQACFLTPDVCFEDAQRYIPQLAAKRGIDLGLVREGLERIEAIAEIIPAELYEQYAPQARARIQQRDIDDWPVVATALLFNCPIWTEDQDFFGTGIPTWTSDRIHLYFFSEEQRHRGQSDDD